MDEDAGDEADGDRGHTERPAPPSRLVIPGNSHLTIYDVARAAGVAPSTVSRALSKPGRGQLPDRRASPPGRR